MSRIIILSSNGVAPDPRIEKEAKTLESHGYEVTIIGWDRSASHPKKIKDIGLDIERIRLKAFSGRGLANLPSLLLFQICLLIRLLLKVKNYKIIHAVDFDTLIPALIIRFIFPDKKLVYDIADFYADMLLRVPRWICKIIRKIDLSLISLADALILADDSRTEQIKGSKPKSITIINNSPILEIEQNSLKIDYPPLRIVYVGLLSVERGLLEMIDVVGRNTNYELHMAGYGGDEKLIVKQVAQFPNIKFYGKIYYDFTLSLTKSSHVLFATYDPSIKNHQYSSPNKLFEAMAFGKPIIVAKDTGVDKIVEKYQLGYVVDYGDKNEIESILKEIASWDDEKRERFSIRVKNTYKNNFSWEIMASRLISLYSKLST